VQVLGEKSFYSCGSAKISPLLPNGFYANVDLSLIGHVTSQIFIIQTAYPISLSAHLRFLAGIWSDDRL
jgi:hypothetical protein